MTEIGRGYVAVDFDDSGVQAGIASASKSIKTKLGGAAHDAAVELQKTEAAAARTGRAVDRAAGRIEAAKRREADAAAKVAIAEARVAEARSKGDAGSARVLAAEEGLRKARLGQVDAANELSKAEEASRVAKEKAAAAADDLAEATKRFASEEDNAAKSTKRFGAFMHRHFGDGSDSMRELVDDVSSATNGMNLLSGAVLKVGAIVTVAASATSHVSALAASIAPVAGLAAALPGAFATGAASMATFKVATGGFTDALKAAGKGEKEFAKATQGMAPVMRDAVRATVDAQKAFAPTSTAVQTAFWDGLDKSITDLAKVAIPSLAGGMTAVATASNGMAKSVLQSLGQIASMGSLDSVFAASERVIKSITPAIQPAMKGVATLVSGSADLVTGFSGAAGAAQKFADWSARIVADGSLASWFEGGKTVAKQLGTLVYDVARAFGGILKAAGQANGAMGLGGLAGTIGKIADAINRPEIQSKLTEAFGRANAIVSTVSDVLVAVLPSLIELGPALMVAAGAWKAFQLGATLASGAQKVLTAWTWLFVPASEGATAGATGLSTAIAGISWPVVAVIAAVAALAAGIVWLYKNNETARNVINGAWSAIQGAVKTAWEGYIKPAFNAIAGFVMGTLVPAISGFWSNTVRPAFTKAGNLIRDVWTRYVSPALSAMWSFISTKVGPIFSWVWSVIKVVFQNIAIHAGNMWKLVGVVFRAIHGFVSSKLGPIFGWLWRSVISPVMGWISGKIGAMWKTVKPILTVFGNYIREKTAPAFKAGVDAIAKAWDTIKAAVKAPVEFVINTVLNKALIGGYNKIVGTFGGTPLKEIPLPWGAGERKSPSYKPRGGRTVYGGSAYDVGGYTGAGGKYEPAGIVHRDEFVLRKESTSKIRRKRGGLQWLYALNRDPERALNGGYHRGGLVDSERPGPFMGGPRTSPLARGDWQVDRGVWRQMKAWLQAHIPGARVTSAFRQTRTATGKISNHARGLAVDIVGSGSTTMMQIFNALRSAFGSQALELIHSPAGAAQIWHGKPHMYTGVTRANHFDHVHWAMPSMDPNAAGGFSLNPFDAVAKAVNGFIDRIPGAEGFVKTVAGMPRKAVDAAKAYVGKKMSELSAAVLPDAAGGPVGSGVQRWSGVVSQALSMLGEPASLLPVVLRRMQQESGGNPRAVNNWDINARRGDPSKGLMQVISGTFRQFAMPGHNTDIFDPLSNVLASMRYAKHRYGSLSKAYNRRGGYHTGGLVQPLKPTLYDTGGILQPGLTLVSNQTNKPETVRTYEQERVLQRQIKGDGQGDVYNITVNEKRVVPELVEALRFAEIKRRNSGRYGKAA